jgi:hypothetical protein
VGTWAVGKCVTDAITRFAHAATMSRMAIRVRGVHSMVRRFRNCMAAVFTIRSFSTSVDYFSCAVTLLLADMFKS